MTTIAHHPQAALPFADELGRAAWLYMPTDVDVNYSTADGEGDIVLVGFDGAVADGFELTRGDAVFTMIDGTSEDYRYEWWSNGAPGGSDDPNEARRAILDWEAAS